VKGLQIAGEAWFRSNLNLPPLVEDPAGFYRSEVNFSKTISSFSFTWKENEAKENARVPLDPARRRCGRSTRKLDRLRLGYGGLRQSARFIPSAPPMLGVGQWEQKSKNSKLLLSHICREDRGPSVLWEKLHIGE